MAVVSNNATGYNSFDVTINADVFTVTRCSLNRSSDMKEQNDKDGEPKGELIIPKNPRGTATLQYDNDPPSIGDTFTHTFDATTGSETFVISDVGEELQAGEFKEIPISFTKQLS
jgi:hypothetical protein